MLYDGSDSVCKFCLDGVENPGVYDPQHGNARCPYCWERDTKHLKDVNGRNVYINGHFKYHCNKCEEDFYT